MLDYVNHLLIACDYYNLMFSPSRATRAPTSAYNRFTEVILDIVREPNGDWKKGHTGNPAGRPPSVFASQNDVADRLLKKYTGEEIRALAADPKRCAKELSSFQEMIIIQLANALNARDNNDNALERERLLDRVVGKPVSRTELTGKNGAPLNINVITGVNAVDAEFVEVVAPALDAIEDQRESELSSAEKLEAKRAKAKAYQREYYAKQKGKPSFNDRLAAKDK